MFGSLVSCALVAYPLARMTFKGRDVIFTIIVLTMLIPWQALMIPQFVVFYEFGWYGSYLPLIVPAYTGSAFFVFLIRQYMKTIPKELDEAARLDGAGHFRIFWSIILPLSKPALAVCAVFTFLGTWNDLLGPVIYLNRQEMFTAAIGLAGFVSVQNPGIQPAHGGEPDHDHPGRHPLLRRSEVSDRRHRLRGTEGMTHRARLRRGPRTAALAVLVAVGVALTGCDAVTRLEPLAGVSGTPFSDGGSWLYSYVTEDEEGKYPATRFEDLTSLITSGELSDRGSGQHLEPARDHADLLGA